MNTETVATAVTEVQGVANTILATVEALDPAVEVPVETTKQIVELVAGLVQAALKSLSAATGTPITIDTVTALLPDPTPLSLPPTP